MRKFQSIFLYKLRTYRIFQICISVPLSLCVPCLKKSKVSNKVLVTKPMIFNKMNSRAQADLIDMQIQPDGDLKWILVYREICMQKS